MFLICKRDVMDLVVFAKRFAYFMDYGKKLTMTDILQNKTY